LRCLLFQTEWRGPLFEHAGYVTAHVTTNHITSPPS
jgi:hypothetical protein